MDIDRVKPGEDFLQVIEEAVGSCETLLALIGRNWLTSSDEAGRRLDNPNDFVRLEIAAALARNIRVIPVLVQGAPMPRPQDLPADLLPLARRHALELSDLRWKHDVGQLINALEKPVVPAPAPVAVVETPPAVLKAELHKVTAPVIGTFYRAPSPAAEPFVKIGSYIDPNTVVCIIEAMKLMMEIQAETSGTVEEVYVENGQPVEYGQELFGIRK